MAISERDLVLPAVYLIGSSASGNMTTSELITHLTQAFEPKGDSAKLLANRSDSRFSQLVRNLKSNSTLVKQGLVYYTGARKQYYRLTKKGKEVFDAVGNLGACLTPAAVSVMGKLNA